MESMFTLMEKLLPNKKMEIIIQNPCKFTSCPAVEVQGQQKTLAVDPLLFLADNDIDNNTYEKPSVPPTPITHQSQSTTVSQPLPTAPTTRQVQPPPIAPPVSHQATAGCQATGNVSSSSSGGSSQNLSSDAHLGPLNGTSGASSQVPRVLSTGASSQVPHIPSSGASSALFQASHVPSSGSSHTLSNTGSCVLSVPCYMCRPLAAIVWTVKALSVKGISLGTTK